MMPLPKPTTTETQKEFIQRCMIDFNMITDFKNKEQRFAVCSQIYKNERS